MQHTVKENISQMQWEGRTPHGLYLPFLDLPLSWPAYKKVCTDVTVPLEHDPLGTKHAVTWLPLEGKLQNQE